MRAPVWTAMLLAFAATPLMAQEQSSAEISPIKVVSDQVSKSSFEQVDAWQQKLKSARAEIDVIEVPLLDALQFVSDRIEIPIRIDERSLAEVGIQTDAEISLQVPEMAAETLLQLLTRELILTYRVDTTGIVITTWEEAESEMHLRFYPVDDLVGDGPQKDYHYLIDVITTCVETPMWEQLGGPGTIKHYQNGLIVDQTYQTHRKLEGLLARLREVKNLSGDQYSTRSLAAFPQDPRTQEVESKLKSVHMPIEFIETPLQEAIDFLGHVSEIPIRLDKRYLTEVGLALDKPITLQSKGLTIEQTLDVLAEQYDLSWYIIGGFVFVTTHEEAERAREIRVYPVRDLVWHGLNIRDPHLRQLLKEYSITVWDKFHTPLGRAQLGSKDMPRMPDYDSLIGSITASADPEMWEELGGPGSIADYPICDCLVVQQTRDVHEKVAHLLQQIRAQRSPADIKKLEEQIRNVNGEVITIRYEPLKLPNQPTNFTHEDLQAIGDQIQRMIEPNSWDQVDHFTIATQGGLIIRHRRDIQRKVLTFLDEIGIGLPIAFTGDFKGSVGASQESKESDSNDAVGKAPAGTGSSFLEPSTGQHGGFF